jgi:GntR family carbon starvation induced transcriptional regulator
MASTQNITKLDASVQTAIEAPLSEQAYRLLRRDILRGDVPPGKKLKIEDLQQHYSFSSSPLREALNRLVAEQLVIADERRGFRVTPISAADFRDLTAYRVVMERGALEDAMQNGTDEWEAGIVAAFHRLEAAEMRASRERLSQDNDWSERHKAFHMSMFAACASRRLVASCSSMFDQSERYRRLSGKHRKEPRQAPTEHKRMMDAAIARDVPLALSLQRDHVLRTADNVTKILAQLVSIEER